MLSYQMALKMNDNISQFYCHSLFFYSDPEMFFELTWSVCHKIFVPQFLLSFYLNCAHGQQN